MDRQFESGAAVAAPGAPAAPSVGYPTAGNPGTGTPATKPGAYWYHMITEEIRKTIVDAGLVPAAGDLTQLSAAIQALGKTKPGAMFMWPTPVCPSWALVRDGAAISRATYAALFAALCPSRNGTTVNGANTLTGLATTADLYVGMPIEGAGIPAGTTIASITGLTTATMSANATAGATVPITLFYHGYGSGGSATTFGVPDDRGLFERGLDTGSKGYDKSTITGTTTNASTAITGIASTRGLFVGQAISGTGVPGGATIASITSSSAITISAAATASATVELTITGAQIGVERMDEIKSHTHALVSIVANNAPDGTGGEERFNPGQTGATGGPETKPKSRAYLPIIAY